MEIGRLVRRTRDVLADQGLAATLQKSLLKLRDFAEYPLVKRRRRTATFSLAGRSYTYLTHHYNATWRNERAVELPLASEFLAELPAAARLLEVGNVLSYYLPGSHAVVDKFEPSPGVINEDILEFGRPKTFDAVVSISTLEHVGWDETPRDADRAERALTHMRSLLTDGGRFFLSFPIGYNPHLDRLVFEARTGFRRSHCLQRVSADNRWEEVSAASVTSVRYGHPYPCANAIFVGID